MEVTMRAQLILGAVMLAASSGCGGEGPTGGDADISGAWTVLGSANSTSGILAPCTISGDLFLNQSGNTASGTFDGSTHCENPDLGSVNNSADGPVAGIQVDGDNVSWSKDSCDLDGEFDGDDRVQGDLTCTTAYLGVPVTIEGTWQLSR
jgi:hypothetical protein